MGLGGIRESRPSFYRKLKGARFDGLYFLHWDFYSQVACTIGN